MEVISIVGIVEKLTTVAAIFVGGAWVYFKAIRGRAFVPRLQPKVGGRLTIMNGTCFLIASIQVENVGSSIARIKEKGTALKISSLRAFGDVSSSVDPTVEKATAFPIFEISKGKTMAIEPRTIIYSQEMIEVPMKEYDAFRVELRVSVVRGGFFSKPDRKWRAFAIVLNRDDIQQQQTKQE